MRWMTTRPRWWPWFLRCESYYRLPLPDRAALPAPQRKEIR